MKSKKIMSKLLVLLVFTSGFGAVGFADDEASVNEITPVAVWDMSTLVNNELKDSTQNGADMFAYFGAQLDPVQDCIYSTQKAVNPSPANSAGYCYFEATGNGFGDVLNVLDTSFTYQTWIKLDPSVITPEMSFSSALFWVMEGANENFPIQLSISKRSDDTQAHLVLRRRFASGERYFEIAKGIEVGEWTNIIIAYDAASVNNKPCVVINGVVSEAKHPGILPEPEGDAILHSSTGRLEMGRTFSGAFQFLRGTSFGKTGFYSGNISEANAIETYNTEKALYEPGYDVKIYDMFSTLVSASDLNKIKEMGNEITVDFAGINRETITPESVYIADMTANDWIEYTGTWNGDIYTISDFVLTEGHNYKLVLKETIEDINGETLHSAEQSISFVCNNASSLIPVASWNANDAQLDGKVGTVLNMLNGSEYPLTIEWADQKNKLHTDVEYNTDSALYSSNLAVWAKEESGRALASQLDGAITYETWVNVNTDVRDTIALFSIGDMGDANHTTFWTGKDGSITFIRKFSQRQGYWFTGGGVLPRDEYVHLMVTYDPSSESNLPVVYVNGTQYNGGWMTSTSPVGAPATSQDMVAPMVTICSGTYNNTYTKLPGAWSASTVYQGVASSYDAYIKYINSRPIYEKAGFGIKCISFKDENGAMSEDILTASSVKVVVTVEHYASDKAPYAYIAVYDKVTGMLKGVSVGTLQSAAIDTLETGTVEIPENCEVKIMLWNEDMEPLCAADSYIK